jgi:phenylalanyl-tRNA synthetase alpha chain
MIESITEYTAEINAFTSSDKNEIENFRIKFLGSKGIIKSLFDDFKNLAPDEKKALGSLLNQLKNAAQEKHESLLSSIETDTVSSSSEDLTKPSDFIALGSRHPISLTRKKIIDIFARIGFTVENGPEIEDDWHNFSGLNFPPEHPARDMQDTFFINQNFALRTHTSSVQVRVMESTQPPIRIIAPGRVFRNEAISSRAHCIFHQIEGLLIDTNVSFADMKQCLLYFAKEMFGDKTKIRLRPSYFPFTEPSAEMDIYWGLKTESDYRITKGTGWLEIMGCGMIDPAVLKNCNINPEQYSGYAFGMGIERIAMILYGIDDIRHYFENDLRFLKQFSSVIA